MLAVAVGANRSLVGTGGNRFTVYAFLIGSRRQRRSRRSTPLQTSGRDRLRRSAECCRARLSTWDRLRAESHARCRGSPGTWRRCCCRLRRLWRERRDRKQPADRRGRWRTWAWPAWIVGKAFTSVWQSVQPKTLCAEALNLLVVDVQADLLAVLLFDQGRVAMASQAFVVAHLRGRRGLTRFLGRRCLCNCRCAEQHGSKKNQTAAFH